MSESKMSDEELLNKCTMTGNCNTDVNPYRAELLSQLKRGRAAEEALQDLRSVNESGFKEAYKILCIEDNGEYRWKWLLLELGNLKEQNEKLKNHFNCSHGHEVFETSKKNKTINTCLVNISRGMKVCPNWQTDGLSRKERE